jgi:hypothetical protein
MRGDDRAWPSGSHLLGQHLLRGLDGPVAVGGHQADACAAVQEVGDGPGASWRTANRSSPTVSGRPATTAAGPSASTTDASVPYRATNRPGAVSRSSAARGAPPTSGNRPVSDRADPRPSRATTASTVSSAIAR